MAGMYVPGDSPLGHPEWWYITLFRAPLEHADDPADACGLPTALTGPASRRGEAAVTGTLIAPVIPSSDPYGCRGPSLWWPEISSAQVGAAMLVSAGAA